MFRTAVMVLIFGVFSPQQPQIFGDWICTKQVDEVTEEDTSYIYTEDLDLRHEANAPALYLRCGKESLLGEYGTVELLILTQTQMEPNSKVRGICRFDGNEPFEWDWKVSKAGEAVFLPLEQILDFIPAARKAQKVAIQLTDSSGTVHAYTFSLMGFTKAVAILGCVKF